MKITLQCPICKNFHEENPEKQRFGIDYTLIYNSDDNISLIDDMRKGHCSVVYFTNYKFDLLFESGLSAIHDLYFREAIASITSGLERFYEYCIEILTFNLDQENYAKLWKTISNQSERQVGAFYFLYFNTFNSLPKYLTEKETSFRNKVIHKGYFPTKNETFEFTKTIYEIIELIMNSLNEKFSNEISLHSQRYKENLIQNATKFINKESKGIQSPYSFEKEPFERTIQTFLFQNGKLEKRDFNLFEDYIRDFYNKMLD